jgi:hypothetical protein
MYLTCEAKPGIMSRDWVMSDGTVRKFKNMMTHEDELMDDDARMKVFNGLLKKLQPVVPIINIELLLHFFGKMIINKLPIIGQEMKEIGSAISVEASIFNHSCCPNAAFVWDGLQLELRALREIPGNQEITVNYIDLRKPKNERKSELKELYYFDCRCERCCSDDDDLHLWNQMKAFQEQIKEIESNVSITDVTKAKEIYLTDLKLLPIYCNFCGDFHPIVTQHLIETMKKGIAFKNTEMDSFDFVYEKLRESLIVTHGKGHSLFLEFEQNSQL